MDNQTQPGVAETVEAVMQQFGLADPPPAQTQGAGGDATAARVNDPAGNQSAVQTTVMPPAQPPEDHQDISTHPAVLALAQAKAAVDDEKTRLLGKNAELLHKFEGYKPYRELGTVDELTQKLTELDELRTAKKAHSLGKTDSAFRSAVAEEAKEVAEQLRARFEPMVQERDAKLETRSKELSELQTRNRQLELQNMFPEVDQQLHKGVSYLFWPRAAQDVVFTGDAETRDHYISMPGKPDQPLPGKDGNNMRFLEYVELLAKGAEGVPRLSGLFRDQGSGSGTTSAPAGKSGVRVLDVLSQKDATPSDLAQAFSGNPEEAARVAHELLVASNA